MTATHFIGLTDDQIERASRIWHVDFVHRWHDRRSHGDIDWDHDTIIFAGRTSEDRISEWSWQDHELH
jgi:hypothetical protein